MSDLEAWEDALAEIVLKWKIEPEAARELRKLLFAAVLARRVSRSGK